MVADTSKIELGLLGCLMQEPSLYRQIDKLTPQDFQYDDTRKLYECIVEMLKDGMATQAETVKLRYLEDNGEEVINAACKEVPVGTLSLARTYTTLISEASARRKLYNLSSNLALSAANGDSISDLMALAKRCAEAVAIAPIKLISKYGDEYEKFRKRVASPVTYFSTGWEQVDKILTIGKGDFIVIGGRPSSGKTAFSLQMALQMSEKYKVVYFSCETSIEKLTDRAVATHAKVNFSKIKHHNLEGWENEEVLKTTADARAKNLWFVNAAGKNVDWITQVALQLEADIIFVDYLGLLKSEGNSPYERTTMTSMALHTTAQQNGLTIIALSQLSRSAADQRPTLTDLRESGQIEQDADAVLLLQKGAERVRAGVGQGVYEHTVFLAKNKEGSTGIMPFRFLGYQQRFEVSNRTEAEAANTPAEQRKPRE